jgi:hypothetical protein
MPLVKRLIGRFHGNQCTKTKTTYIGVASTSKANMDISAASDYRN